MRKCIAIALLGQLVVCQQDQQTNTTQNQTSETQQALQDYAFISSHDVAEHDIVYSTMVPETSGNETSGHETSGNSTNMPSLHTAFCTIRQDKLYFSGDDKSGNCHAALLIQGGLDRSLDLNLQLGNVTHENMTEKKKHSWQKKKSKYQKFYSQKSETQKMIDEETKKVTLKNKNVTQEIMPYTQFNNYKNHSVISTKEGTPHWILNITSLGFGNYSEPAIIDPEFPYLQVSPIQFKSTLLDKLQDVGFKKVQEKRAVRKSTGGTEDDVVTYQIDQKCEVLFGCFEAQRYILSGVKKPNEKVASDDEMSIEYQMNPIDYMIQSYKDNGGPLCTLGISTCSPNSKCPTTLGAVFLKSFDTVLDYESDSILMRTTPKTIYKKSQDLCWNIAERAKRRTMTEQLFDGIQTIENDLEFWSNPINIYNIFFQKDSKWLKYTEYTLAIFAALSMAAIVFTVMAFGMVEGEYYLFQLSEEYDFKDLIKNLKLF